MINIHEINTKYEKYDPNFSPFVVYNNFFWFKYPVIMRSMYPSMKSPKISL